MSINQIKKEYTLHVIKHTIEYLIKFLEQENYSKEEVKIIKNFLKAAETKIENV